MNYPNKNLNEFWKELTTKSNIKLEDIEKLKITLGKAFMNNEDLEKSRDLWRKKFEVVISLIDEDIKLQESKLTKDIKKDRELKYRIVGMKWIKQEFKLRMRSIK